MALFEIRPKDYTDLSETLSEKNIINTVEGKEYEVVTLEDTSLNEKTINPETVSRIFKTYDLSDNTGNMPKYNGDLQVRFADAWLKNIFGGVVDEGFPRTEALFIAGTYEFDTEEVLSDINSVACKFTINYDKVKTNNITRDRQKITGQTAFFSYQYPISEDQEYVQRGLIGEQNEFLPAENAEEIVTALFAKETYKVSAPYRREYCEVEKVTKTADGYKVKIKYCFRIWGGWTLDTTGSRHFNEGIVLSVNFINITTVATTVDVAEIPFFYQNELVNTERKYELETNELFQANSEDLEQDRLSYKTYQKIVEAYDTDRRIITFDLLNPIKQTINDSEKFEAGREESRYLDTDDEFDIYDEHNVFMGTFKVLQGNPIWDGSYHKRITAILVD